MSRRQFLLWSLFAGFVGSSVALADDAALRLDPALPYQAARSNPVTYDVELVATVTAPYKTKLLRVWLPIPVSEGGQDVISSAVSAFPEDVAAQVGVEPMFGNRFAYFEFPNPQGAQQIRHQLKMKVWELRWNLDEERVVKVSEWPEGFDRYRRSESQAVVTGEPFQELLAEIVPRPGNPLRDFEAVLVWTDRNFRYDHAHASLKASSRHALEMRTGHCSDYHGFCAAMGRLLGQPTRVTYGINAFPKASPSHCKLEAFLPPYGWVSFDVSETQKLAAAVRARSDLSDKEKETLTNAARRRLTRGFRDNTWFCQTRGTDYELVPAAANRAAVVRTIYAEADGKALPDPDPSNIEETRFSWMTSHRFQADRVVKYPFTDVESLREWGGAESKSKPKN